MFTKNPYNNQCTSQHKSRCKNRLPSILILFACTFLSFQPVSAYTYVFGDDLNFLRKSDTSHIVLPESDILFYPQAPLANWEKQNESCEEASASLLYRNMYGIPKISPEDFDAELDRLNAFEEFQGIPRNKILTLKSGEDKAYVQDLSIEQVADLLLEQYFHIQQERVFILNHPTIDDMERLLGNNFMLLVPVNTFEVKNIYANHATYHIMPIAGYDESSFLSLDVSTRKGFKLAYEKNLLLQSIRNNSDRILFIDSPASNFSQIKKDALLKSIDTKATAFKVELTSRLESVPLSKRKEVLHRVNTALLNKISNATDDTKKMEFKRFHLIVSGELRKKVSEQYVMNTSE